MTYKSLDHHEGAKVIAWCEAHGIELTSWNRNSLLVMSMYGNMIYFMRDLLKRMEEARAKEK